MDVPSNKVNTLALSGKGVDFSRVIAMIDEMVTLLEAEQVGDDNKKAYCIKSFDVRDDEAKAPARQIAGQKEAIEDHKDQLSSKHPHIEAVRKSIPELDESVTKVTEGRQKQHADLIHEAHHGRYTRQLHTKAVKKNATSILPKRMDDSDLPGSCTRCVGKMAPFKAILFEANTVARGEGWPQSMTSA